VTSEHLYIGDCTGPSKRRSQRPFLPGALLRPESSPVIQANPCPPGSETTACGPGHASFEEVLALERDRNAFLLDYVIHGQQGVGGPHAIEVKLANVNLYWPFLANMQLVMDTVLVYSHFVHVDFVHRNLPCTTNARWMFVNVVLTNGQLLIISPHPAILGLEATSMKTWLPAVALRWELLRVGYNWGGTAETVLLVNLHKLSVSLVKSVATNAIKRSWNHRAGLQVEHPELLKPVSGQIRWQAAKPPGSPHKPPVDTQPRQASAAGSICSTFSHVPSSVSRAREQGSCLPTNPVEEESEWSTTHEHTLDMDLDSVQLQPVLSSRWYLQSFIEAVQVAMRSSSSPQKAGAPVNTEAAPLLQQGKHGNGVELGRQAYEAVQSENSAPVSPGSGHKLVARGRTASVPSEQSVSEVSRGAPRWLPPANQMLSPSGASCSPVAGASTRLGLQSLGGDTSRENSTGWRSTQSHILGTVGTTAMEMKRRAALFTDKMMQKKQVVSKGGRRLLTPRAISSFVGPAGLDDRTGLDELAPSWCAAVHWCNA
jgi:hypothetical protein